MLVPEVPFQVYIVGNKTGTDRSAVSFLALCVLQIKHNVIFSELIF